MELKKELIHPVSPLDEWGMEEAVESFSERSVNYTMSEKPAIFYAKGTNGAGKSTIPHAMVELDDDAYCMRDPESRKVLFTVFPRFDFISIGPYKAGATFGGCDALHKEHVFKALNYLENASDYAAMDIYLEGIMTSDTATTYYEYMQGQSTRDPVVLFFSTPWKSILERIQKRTGKTDVEMEALKGVRKKFDGINRAREKYAAEQRVFVVEVDTSGTKEEYVQRFFDKNFTQVTPESAKKFLEDNDIVSKYKP